MSKSEVVSLMISLAATEERYNEAVRAGDLPLVKETEECLDAIEARLEELGV
jgi:hypothetical protein